MTNTCDHFNMLKKIAFIILSSALFLLSSCGSDNDTAVITYLVTSNVGDIGEIFFIDNNGEDQTNGTPGRRTWTRTFSVPDGTFLYVSAGSLAGGITSNLSIKILSNGAVISEGTGIGEVGPPPTPPQVTVEGFATVNPVIE